MTLQQAARASAALLLLLLASRCSLPRLRPRQLPTPAVFGYADFAAQAKIEEKFLAVPDAKLAGQHLKTLTAEPHLAATPEDHKTAEYVAQKFRAAGLETEIVPYRVLLNQPKVGRASRPRTPPANCSSAAPPESTSTAIPARTIRASSCPSTAPPAPAT